MKTSEQQTNGGGEGKFKIDTGSSSGCKIPERGESDGKEREDVDPLNVVSTIHASPG